MKKLIFMLLFILITPNLFADNPLQFAWDKNGKDEWITEDTVLQITFLSTLTVDAWQTYTGIYTGDRDFNEINPVLGKHPSKKRFFTYWSACAIGHTTISYILPKPYRTIWQFIWIGIEGNCIYHNYKLGAKIKF